MQQIPSCEPQQIVAGDTVQWTKSLSDYRPSDGWNLKYRFVGASTTIDAANITVAANTSGGWDVTILAANTQVAAGVYRLIGWVEDVGATNRFTIVDRAITIQANLATGDAASLLTDNQKNLAAIDARLAGRLTADQETIQINGTSIVRIPIERLRVLRGHYAAAVWRDLNPDVSNPVHKMSFGRV